MMHDDLDRRIQDELDGVATAEESAELKRRLEASPAARARFDEMSAVFRMLDRVEAVEPPPALKERVILALPPVPASSRRGVLSGAFGRRGGLGWGYSFAAGLAAGVLVAVLANGMQNPRPQAPEHAKFSGSMAPLETKPSATVDEIRLELDGARAKVEALHAGPDVLVRLESDVRSAEILVEYDASGFSPRAFERTGPEPGSVELAPGRILIRAAGHGRYEFFLEPAGPARPPLQVSLTTRDEVASRSLRTGPARRE